MKNYYIIHLILIILLITANSYALEEISDSELMKTTGGAGISIAFDQVSVEHYNNSIKLSNPDNDSFISFENIHCFYTTNGGVYDVNLDTLISPITIDISSVESLLAPGENRIYFYLNTPDLTQKYQFDIGNINFNGTDIGSINITNNMQNSGYLYAGSHENTGFYL